MASRIIFVTGTDTGIGKTVLTCLLTRHLRAGGVAAVALKPVAAGSRSDARALRRASGAALPLDQINPWHFRPPLAPPLTTAGQRAPLWKAAVARHCRQMARTAELVLIEGAGGLLSPLTRDGDNRDLMRSLGARPLVVVPDRLGAINQALLVQVALTASERRAALWVLVAPRRETTVHRRNRAFLRRRLGAARVFVLPRLRADRIPASAHRMLMRLAARLRGHAAR